MAIRRPTLLVGGPAHEAFGPIDATRRCAQPPLAPAQTRRTSQVTEVTLCYSRDQAIAETDRCMSCGVCNGCDHCYIVCPDVSVLRDARQNGHYSVRTDYRRACLVCGAGA